MLKESLRDVYHAESGKMCCDRSSGNDVPTWQYVEWLEERLNTSEGQKPAQNSDMAKCLCGWKVVGGKGERWFPSQDCPLPDHSAEA